jgi:hypothetical protein
VTRRAALPRAAAAHCSASITCMCKSDKQVGVAAWCSARTGALAARRHQGQQVGHGNTRSPCSSSR